MLDYTFKLGRRPDEWTQTTKRWHLLLAAQIRTMVTMMMVMMMLMVMVMVMEENDSVLIDWRRLVRHNFTLQQFANACTLALMTRRPSKHKQTVKQLRFDTMRKRQRVGVGEATSLRDQIHHKVEERSRPFVFSATWKPKHCRVEPHPSTDGWQLTDRKRLLVTFLSLCVCTRYSFTHGEKTLHSVAPSARHAAISPFRIFVLSRCFVKAQFRRLPLICQLVPLNWLWTFLFVFVFVCVCVFVLSRHF